MLPEEATKATACLLSRGMYGSIAAGASPDIGPELRVQRCVVPARNQALVLDRSQVPWHARMESVCCRTYLDDVGGNSSRLWMVASSYQNR